MLMSIPPKIVEARSEDNCHNLVQIITLCIMRRSAFYSSMYNSTEVFITSPSFPVTSIVISPLFILIIPTLYQDRDFLTFIINDNCIRFQICKEMLSRFEYQIFLGVIDRSNCSLSRYVLPRPFMRTN